LAFPIVFLVNYNLTLELLGYCIDANLRALKLKQYHKNSEHKGVGMRSLVLVPGSTGFVGCAVVGMIPLSTNKMGCYGTQ